MVRWNTWACPVGTPGSHRSPTAAHGRSLVSTNASFLAPQPGPCADPPGLMTLSSGQLVETATALQRRRDQQRSLGRHVGGPYGAHGNRAVTPGLATGPSWPDEAAQAACRASHQGQPRRATMHRDLPDRPGAGASARWVIRRATASPSDWRLTKPPAAASVTLQGMAPVQPETPLRLAPSLRYPGTSCLPGHSSASVLVWVSRCCPPGPDQRPIFVCRRVNSKPTPGQFLPPYVSCWMMNLQLCAPCVRLQRRGLDAGTPGSARRWPS